MYSVSRRSLSRYTFSVGRNIGIRFIGRSAKCEVCYIGKPDLSALYWDGSYIAIPAGYNQRSLHRKVSSVVCI